MLLLVFVVVLPLVVLGVLAWRFGANSRDWRESGDWDWLHHPVRESAPQ